MHSSKSGETGENRTPCVSQGKFSLSRILNVEVVFLLHAFIPLLSRFNVLDN